MDFFRKKRLASGNIAKDRLRLLLVADRVSCSPQILHMLKKDMIKAAAKYIPVDITGVTVMISQSPPMLVANIPLKNEESNSHMSAI